jgi:HTH-type transcriptional regulator/antitoxin HipB
MTFVEYIVAAWSRIGAIVREERRRSGRTQAQLAQHAGVSRGWLVRLEAGHPSADPATVIPVLRALDLELVVRAARTSEEQLAEERRLEELLGNGD